MYAVLATGPSLTQAQVDIVTAAGCKIVAVSDAIYIAPNADVIVSSDSQWWEYHKDILDYPQPKYGLSSAGRLPKGVQEFIAKPQTNSGLLGIMVAQSMGAKKIIVLGLDMRDAGNHFFGRHPEKLTHTTAVRLQFHKNQFNHWTPKVPVYNCSPDSAMDVYHKISLEDAINV